MEFSLRKSQLQQDNQRKGKYKQRRHGSQQLNIRTRNNKIEVVNRRPANNSTTDKKLHSQVSEISNSYGSVIFSNFNLHLGSWEGPLFSRTGRTLYNGLSKSVSRHHVSKHARCDNILHHLFHKRYVNQKSKYRSGVQQQ